MRAAGMHYGPTRIYGPTGHAIGGTALQALRSLTTAAMAAGPRRYQRRLRAGRSSRKMDLAAAAAAAAAGIRATRMSLLWAGRSS
jgi:hypothetical protein